ncbi:hypothetical protein GCM10010435_83630 [Winogradskya consettensis]|uniref:Peptidase inhibitor family I36 n=1 Tax=Winogradskya consettensis TaxID=113560 RepID=A0A919VY85_9ACTN|nr:peptidase inhibitor family I36 protein [Actinoplanes consettensis]GIM82216.1 hypothetical protein Aco04nite_80470 [Actinoplanes consettensis]
MRMKPVIAAAVAAVGVIAGMFAVPVAASAATCTAGKFCVWMDNDYLGPTKAIANTQVPSFDSTWKFSDGSFINDNISSFYNNTGHDIVVCADVNYKGAKGVIRAGMSYASIGEFNDTITSFTSAG